MEFERAKDMGRYQGMDIEMMSVPDMKDAYPFMETHDLAGGLYDPDDGDIDPAQLTQALAKGARDMGAKDHAVLPRHWRPATATSGSCTPTKGDIRCEKVVNAAGYYAQRVGEWFKPYGGRTVPMVDHEPPVFPDRRNPGTQAWWTEENGRKLPLLRDVDSSYYLRQEKNGLNLGPYERNCKAHWVTPDDPMPEDFSFQLYPGRSGAARMVHRRRHGACAACWAGQGVGRVINGPIPYAPDGSAADRPDAGRPERVMKPACSPLASPKAAAQAKCWPNGSSKARPNGTCGRSIRAATPITPIRTIATRKAMEVYGHEYAMHFPHHEWPAARDKKLSPIDGKIRDCLAA